MPEYRLDSLQRKILREIVMPYVIYLPNGFITFLCMQPVVAVPSLREKNLLPDENVNPKLQLPRSGKWAGLYKFRYRKSSPWIEVAGDW